MAAEGAAVALPHTRSMGGGGRAIRFGLIGVLGIALLAGYLSVCAASFAKAARRESLATGHRPLPSDLYATALGARALAAGRDPYGDAFRVELHQALYGQVLQPSPLVPNVAAFAYPPYVVLLMWPLFDLPYEVVRWIGSVLMAAAVCAAAVWWVRLVRGAAPRWVRVAAAAGALVSLPTLQLIWLQQPTGVVLLLLVAAHAAAARGRYAVAGGLLALATVKPQLTVLVGGGLLFWALWQRARWPLLAGFGATMAGQLALSWWLLPTWPRAFLGALSHYRALNSYAFWLPADIAGGSTLGGGVVAGSLLAALAWSWWRCRRRPLAGQPLRVAALGFAVGVAVMPDVSLYSRAMLVVPLITVGAAVSGPRPLRRAVFRMTALVVVLPVLLMGVTGWARWLVPGEAVGQLALDAAKAIYVALPVLVLPGGLALCVEGAEPGIDEVSRRPVGRIAAGQPPPAVTYDAPGGVASPGTA